MTFINPPYCHRLGIPFSFDTGIHPLVSFSAIHKPPVYYRARAACLFEESAKTLIHSLKYGNRQDIAILLGHLMVQAGMDVLETADLIIPVPLHWSRLLYRRFNQSTLLAEEIAKHTAKPLRTDILSRKMRTPQQVGLTVSQRKRNVLNAFKVSLKEKSQIQDRNILLIDDVITTGSTVEACARTLLRSGAKSVDVLAFAKVTEHTDAFLADAP